MSSKPALPPPGPPVLRITGVNHHFGAGDTRTQVLFDNTLEVMPGELVIMSGPSGSGKTTLLTLIGGLRTLQDGEIEVWDADRGDYRKLRGTPEPELVNVRRLIGFIFQRHNLFDSLTAMQNVRMAQRLKPTRRRPGRRRPRTPAVPPPRRPRPSRQAAEAAVRLQAGGSSPAGSGSASRSPGRSSTGRSSSSPTSRPRRSTPTAASRS